MVSAVFVGFFLFVYGAVEGSFLFTQIEVAKT